MEEAVCRNIKTLFNYDPPPTDEDIQASALQYVRKISGYREPSQANQEAFDKAVEEVAAATRQLLNSLTTKAPPRNRELEILKARNRYGRGSG